MSKVLLGDVAIERKETCKGSKNGYPIVGLEHLTSEEITLSAWEEDKENSFSKLFHEGDVLFGRRRAYLKKAVVAPFNGICSGDITVIKAIPEKILPELLPFVVQNDALFDFAINNSAGSLSPRVKWERLKNYEFWLPDMDKQRELAKVLWAMDATKKSYQKLLLKTDELVKSQFIEMFGDPLYNTMGWPVKALNEICDVRDGTHDSPSYIESGYPLVTSKNVVDGKLDLLNVKYISKEDFLAISKRSKVDKGDIIMPMIGTIGKPLIISTEPNFAIKNVALIKFNKTDITNVYIQQLLSLSSFLEGAIMAKSKGITQKFIALGDIRKLSIPVPPIELQKEFVSFVQQSDKSKFELKQALAELTAAYKKIISENLG